LGLINSLITRVSPIAIGRHWIRTSFTKELDCAEVPVHRCIMKGSSPLPQPRRGEIREASRRRGTINVRTVVEEHPHRARSPPPRGEVKRSYAGVVLALEV